MTTVGLKKVITILVRRGSDKGIYGHFFFHFQPWLCPGVHPRRKIPGYTYNFRFTALCYTHIHRIGL